MNIEHINGTGIDYIENIDVNDVIINGVAIGDINYMDRLHK